MEKLDELRALLEVEDKPLEECLVEILAVAPGDIVSLDPYSVVIDGNELSVNELYDRVKYITRRSE